MYPKPQATTMQDRAQRELRAGSTATRACGRDIDIDIDIRTFYSTAPSRIERTARATAAASRGGTALPI